MKKTQFILAVTLLAGGLSFAGTDYKKMVVTPEPVCGPWYVSAYGGGSFFDEAAYTESAAFGVPSSTLVSGLDNGWIIGGAVGLRTQNAWRFELDLNHTQAPFDSATFGGFFPAPLVTNVGGEIERTSLMVNAVKEFPALQFLGLTPYLGAGVGLTNVEVDLTSVLFGNIGDADELVLGYQFIGGLVFDLTECLQVYAEYRLQGLGDLEDAAFGPGYGDLDLGWAQHVIMGVRWFF